MTTAKSNPVQTVQPYLFFDGRCEEAIEFYRSTLGAESGDALALQGLPRSQRVRARSRGQGDACQPPNRRHDIDGFRWPMRREVEV